MALHFLVDQREVCTPLMAGGQRRPEVRFGEAATALRKLQSAPM
jgi:hypothetical protein